MIARVCILLAFRAAGIQQPHTARQAEATTGRPVMHARVLSHLRAVWVLWPEGSKTRDAMTRYYVCMNVFVCCRIDAPKAHHIGYNVCVLYMCGLCQPVDDVHAVNGRTQRRHAVSPLQQYAQSVRACYSNVPPYMYIWRMAHWRIGTLGKPEYPSIPHLDKTLSISFRPAAGAAADAAALHKTRLCTWHWYFTAHGWIIINSRRATLLTCE